ncbi:uncharacterized protein LOC133314839 [Gastrolobium bilobum]|uniref:uncharacterized protein LOC133314839 n=1 Tax=Gastrolobium bilobum TaxID=150636 RepID=UPI002AB1A18C|nr:uncharacterized protein LOC133314839 [Gastrolobium bilobum]
MSLQAQPQQPVQVYPTTVTNQPSSHHSKGSFGAVFIVLAIILVISIVACILGRLCNRLYNNKHNHNSQRPDKLHRQQIHNFHPREGDIEFGDDNKRMPPTTSRPNKVHGHGADTGPQQPPSNGNMKDFVMKPGHEIHNFHSREGDIEFGVDRRMPPTTARPKGHGHGAGSGSTTPANVNTRGFVLKSVHDEELRVGA